MKAFGIAAVALLVVGCGKGEESTNDTSEVTGETGMTETGATDTGATGTDTDTETDTETDVEWATVTDSESGLKWEVHAAPHEFTNHADAAAYCANIEEVGINSWRLPTLEEYMEVVGGCEADVIAGEAGSCTPCADSERCNALFPNERTESAWYWTSTSYATEATLMAYMGMHDGRVGYVNEDLHNLTRCVTN